MYINIMGYYIERERERQVYLQPDGLDSNTYNTYNINIIKYLQYGRHTGTTNICLLPVYNTSKEPVCPRVELILKIIIILLIIFLGFIKSKPC